jgi:hypothetical protein
MKKYIALALVPVALVFGMIEAATAALVVNGVDSRGAKLIYDTDLDITWYDYADENSAALDWQSAVNWTSSLSVTVNGNTYTEWRLPSTVGGSGNINVGEMGHLYYSELLNAPGVETGNQGPFSNLLIGYANAGYSWTSLPSAFYYDGTAYAHYRFSFGTGNQASYSDYHGMRAFAVHDGNVGSPVPAPSSIILFGHGIFTFAWLNRRKPK